jgi:hypothetical protein
MQPTTTYQPAASGGVFSTYRAARIFARELGQGCDGSLTLEYAVLIGSVSLGGALGLVGIGLSLLDSFVAIRSGVLAPFP